MMVKWTFALRISANVDAKVMVIHAARMEARMAKEEEREEMEITLEVEEAKWKSDILICCKINV